MTRRAFTLFEVLVVIALAAVLLASMFGFLFDMLSARTRALEFTARQRAVTVLVDRLEADLMTCLVGDRTHGAGVRGDATSLRLLSRSVAAGLAGRGPEDPALLADLLDTTYRFVPATGMIEARRGVAGDATTPPAWSPLGGSIAKLRFRYHDGRRWRDRFDSLAGGLPTAVEVAVWFDPWPGEEDLEETFDAEGAGPTDRLTFDPDAGFDEEAFAEASDLDVFVEPVPDRVRVITVPDAGGEEPS